MKKNNVYRRIVKLPPRSIASAMYANNTCSIDSFKTLLRKRTCGFIERLKKVRIP